MQDQIYRILSSLSGKPLRQIIRDTKRTDFYLDAKKALEYGLIDAIVPGELQAPEPAVAGDGAERIDEHREPPANAPVSETPAAARESDN
jgi:hypothetical protein